MKHSRSYQIRRLTAVALLSALATALLYWEIFIPFVPSFLEYDFSDLPALIGAFAYGPVAGILIELIKNLIHIPAGGSSGVGELANFLLGVAFVVPAGLVYHLRKDKIGAVSGAVSGTLISALIAFPVNFYILIPFFAQLYMGGNMSVIVGMYSAICPAADAVWKGILIFHVPLVFVKGCVNVLITFLIYKKISPLLHGKT